MSKFRYLIIFIVFLTCIGIIFSGSKSSFAEAVVQKTDFDKALYLAEKDRNETQLEIGVVHDLGLGTPQNDMKMHKWFNLAEIKQYKPDATFIPIEQQSDDWAITRGFKHSMYQQFGENWRAVIPDLIITAIITWGIGLTPPLLIRFAIIRRPLRAGWAIGTVFILYVINMMILTVLGNGISPHTTTFLIAIASYFILKIDNLRNLSGFISTVGVPSNNEQDTNPLFKEKGNGMMNLKQIIILKGAAALILVSFLFPPFEYARGPGVIYNGGYNFIFTAPRKEFQDAIVNIEMLLTQLLGILLLTGILWLLQMDEKSND